MLRTLLSKLRRETDPYEDFYLNAPVADPRNLVDERIRQAPEGSVFAVKAETHTPEVIAEHVKELGRFFGADATYIVSTSGLSLPEGREEGLPYAVFCLFKAEHDPRQAPGMGGHVAPMKGAFATFQIGAIIREFGYRAERLYEGDADRLAAEAGIGVLDERGRLNTRAFGSKVHVADVILTDLPVATDAPEASR